MKKFISAFLSFIMTFLILTASVPVAFAAEYTGACGSGVVWNLNTYTGELSISGSGNMKDYSADELPSWSTYQNYIKTVTVSDGITSVGAYAFYNISGYKYQKLTSVSLSDSVVSIGAYAFRGCKAIDTVVGAGVEQICEYAFRSCENLSALTLDSVISVGNGAFSYCSGLTDLPMLATVTEIGQSAFKGCTGLTSLVLSDNITILGDQSFAECTGLTDVEFSASAVNSSVSGAFFGSGAESGMNITFGSNVTVVPGRLFENCTNLNHVTLGSAVTTVEDYAFYSSGVRSVYVSSSVKTVGSFSFGLCNQLVSFTVESSNLYFSAGSLGELLNRGGTILYRYPSGRTDTTYTAHSLLRRIGNGAFSGDDDLVNVYLENVISVYEKAFIMCNSLQCIELPSVTLVETYAFADCDSLVEVSAPKVSTLAEGTFWGCDALEDLSGFTALGSIGEYAFANCQGFLNLSIPSTVTSIEDYAFYNCEELSTLVIPSSVTEIRAGAFLSCANLASLTLSEGLQIVYQEAFLDCPALLSVKIPESVTDIGVYAFGYTYKNGVYVAVSGFKIYCYNSTGGYEYAYNNQSALSYEVVTDSIGGEIVPEEEIVSPEQEKNIFFDMISVILNLFDYIKKLIFS